jgi:hypothetical protein
VALVEAGRYLPDYPEGNDGPTDYSPGTRQWFIDEGTVPAHIPLSALGSVLRV